MDYRRFGDTIFLRLDKGEEVLEQLKTVALKEKVTLGDVSALGATDDFTVGVFCPEEKAYHPTTFHGFHEITSIIGTINTMNGEFYTHLHMNAASEGGKTVGGHLSRAVIGLTCEMVIHVAHGTVDREHNEALGFNMMKF